MLSRVTLSTGAKVIINGSEDSLVVWWPVPVNVGRNELVALHATKYYQHAYELSGS